MRCPPNPRFRRCSFRRCSFRRCSFRRCSFRRCSLRRCSFRRSRRCCCCRRLRARATAPGSQRDEYLSASWDGITAAGVGANVACDA
ncbi:MAG: pentapeptide repeat-containing protein [Polyangiaceae bacterium]|nr:pentapeptide repeat-containing protein [Polyangiaceae bacterium]